MHPVTLAARRRATALLIARTADEDFILESIA